MKLLGGRYRFRPVPLPIIEPPTMPEVKALKQPLAAMHGWNLSSPETNLSEQVRR